MFRVLLHQYKPNYPRYSTCSLPNNIHIKKKKIRTARDLHIYTEKSARAHTRTNARTHTHTHTHTHQVSKACTNGALHKATNPISVYSKPSQDIYFSCIPQLVPSVETTAESVS